MRPIQFEGSADICLFTTNDEITLEYDDTVILTFTPDNPHLLFGIERDGEYIRDTATVSIIDNDSKLAELYYMYEALIWYNSFIVVLRCVYNNYRMV